MIEPYAWTTDPDEEADDAVVVDLKGDRTLSSVGQHGLASVLAVIFWSDNSRRYHSGRTVLDGPYSVPKALKHARVLCQQGISIEHRSLWLPEWGVLRTIEGLD